MLDGDPVVRKLNAEIEDLTKANAILHGLLGNRNAEIAQLRVALREARQAINDYGLDDFEETTHETLAKIDEALRDEQKAETTK